MNNERRKRISALKERIEAFVGELASDIKEELEAIRDEEQDCLDNMPESRQNGERGQSAEDAVDKLEEAIAAIETLESDAGDIINSMEEAAQ